METQSLLEPYRVLDLTEGGCLIGGKILGDMGADVIMVEKPRGNPTRNIGPFYHDIPDLNKSLFWFAYSANKRGITLDIDTADGQDIFKRLVKTAHFVIESFPPGHMARLGLGYDDLSKVNPGIILVSITPYGQTGPKAHYKGSELTNWASGGQFYITGDPDRPPNWVGFPQAGLHGGAEGAAAALIAHWHRVLTGEGQQIDVSIQACCVGTLMHTLQMWDLTQFDFVRTGYDFVDPISGVRRTQGFRCRDGYVCLMVMGGGNPAMAGSSQALVEWMAEEGMAPEWLGKFDWVNEYDVRNITQELVGRVEEPIVQFLLTKTKAELYSQAIKRKILLAPVSTAKDVAEDEQLQAREFWQQLEHPELGDTLTYCGPFVKLSQPLIKNRRRAPLIGEHNKEIYEGELGLSSEEITFLKEAGVI